MALSSLLDGACDATVDIISNVAGDLALKTYEDWKDARSQSIYIEAHKKLKENRGFLGKITSALLEEKDEVLQEILRDIYHDFIAYGTTGELFTSSHEAD